MKHNSLNKREAQLKVIADKNQTNLNNDSMKISDFYNNLE